MVTILTPNVLSICFFHSSGKHPSSILSTPSQMLQIFSWVPLLCALLRPLPMNSSFLLIHLLYLRELFSESTSHILYHITVAGLPPFCLSISCFTRKKRKCLNVEAVAPETGISPIKHDDGVGASFNWMHSWNTPEKCSVGFGNILYKGSRVTALGRRLSYRRESLCCSAKLPKYTAFSWERAPLWAENLISTCLCVNF